MSIVEVKNVSKVFLQGSATIKALDEVSVTVREGGFVALAGPSGSGKTTLLNIIGGLDSVDSGQVLVGKQDITAMNPAELAEMRLHKIGFIFQAYNLIPVLSALENVEYVMQLQGVAADERRRRAMAVLDDMGLADKYHRRPATLSGGQQQRVAVARAIVSDPAIVLADEPTANLDSATGRDLLELMKRMSREKGVTFIFSTHDSMVMEYAERLIKIRDGRLVDE